MMDRGDRLFLTFMVLLGVSVGLGAAGIMLVIAGSIVGDWPAVGAGFIVVIAMAACIKVILHHTRHRREV